jgi:hypothetical protein
VEGARFRCVCVCSGEEDGVIGGHGRFGDGAEKMRTLRLWETEGRRRCGLRKPGDGAWKLVRDGFLFSCGPYLYGLHIVENAIAKDHWYGGHSYGLVGNIH